MINKKSLLKIRGYLENSNYHKNSLWVRIAAAKLNHRGLKPLPQPIQLELCR
jgi:hypothetical protein